MANRMVLDFERGTITWDTDNQYGTEICPNLAEKEDDILDILGYAKYDMTRAFEVINQYLNGLLTEDQAYKALVEALGADD